MSRRRLEGLLREAGAVGVNLGVGTPKALSSGGQPAQI